MVLKSSALEQFQTTQTLGSSWWKQTHAFLEILNLGCTQRKFLLSMCSQSHAEVFSHLFSPVMTTWTFSWPVATRAFLTPSWPLPHLLLAFLTSVLMIPLLPSLLPTVTPRTRQSRQELEWKQQRSQGGSLDEPDLTAVPQSYVCKHLPRLSPGLH